MSSNQESVSEHVQALSPKICMRSGLKLRIYFPTTSIIQKINFRQNTAIWMQPIRPDAGEVYSAGKKQKV